MNPLFLFRKEMTPIRKLLLMHLAAGGKLIEESATGNPLSFTTNVAKPLRAFTMSMLPTQSGTGEPYPPGGGKNLCPPSPFERGQYSSGVWMADVARITSDYIQIEPHTNYMISVDADNTANVALINYNLFDSSKNWLGSRSENGDSSFNGDKTHLLNATFNDTAYVRLTVRDATNTASSLSGITLADADLMLEKGSSATSFMPYSNIRPISGWTGVTGWHTGKNLYTDENTTNGYLNSQGEEKSSSSYIITDYMPVTGDTNYVSAYTQLDVMSTSMYLAWYDENKTLISTVAHEANNVFQTVHSPANAKYCRDSVRAGKKNYYIFGTGNSYPVVFPALGKNLLNPATLEQGSIFASSGTNDSSDYRVRTNGYIPLKSGQYTVSAVGVGQAMFFVYDNDKTYIKSESSSGFANLPRTLTLSADRNVRISFRVSSNNEAVTPSDVTSAMFEQSSSATAYEPYTNTVYGGSLDLTTGVLTATWKQVMLGGRDWATNSSNEQFIMLTTKLTDSVVCENNDKTVRCYCDQFKAVSAYKATNRDAQNPQAEYDTAIISSNRLYTVQSIDKFPNSQSFSVWCNSNNVQVVYELETPITYQLTPQQITSLVGTNTIWSNANGDCSVTYLKKG